MPVNHTCTENCFTKRLSAKNIINCYCCNHRCNLKCFQLTSNLIVNELSSSDSNAIFVCTNCHPKIKQWKHRRSSLEVSSLSKKGSATSIDGCPKLDPITDNTLITQTTDNNKKSNLSTSIESINLLNTMNDRLIGMEQNLRRMNDLMNIKNTNDNHTSQQNNLNSRENLKDNLDDKIFSEILKISNGITKIATTEQLKSSISNVCMSIDKRIPSKDLESNSSNHKPMHKSLILNKIDGDRNLLDWSFLNDSNNCIDVTDGRPSIVVKQSIDDSVVEIIKNSDMTTWKTLDVLLSEIKTQSEKLDRINDNAFSGSITNDGLVTICREINLHNEKIDALLHACDKAPFSITKSPLVESIVDLDDSENSTLSQSAFDIDATQISRNFSVMKKLSKEAMSQPNNDSNNVPETLKYQQRKKGQKRQKSISSDGGPRNDLNVGIHSNLDATEIFSNDMLTMEINQAMNAANLPNDDEPDVNQIRTNLISNLNDPMSHTARADVSHQLVNPMETSIGFPNSLLESELMSAIDVSTAYTPNNDTLQTEFNSNNKRNKIEFHLSKFNKNTTTQMILEYIRNKNIDTNGIEIHRLVPKNRDVSTLSFISFKIDSDEITAEIIGNSSFWPNPCTIKKFINKTPKIVNFLESPFLLNNET